MHSIISIPCLQILKYVIHETIRGYKLDKKLTSLGFNKPALDCAIGVITAHIWLQTMAAIDGYLETDFHILS